MAPATESRAQGDTFEKALDGNVNTRFDAAHT